MDRGGRRVWESDLLLLPRFVVAIARKFTVIGAVVVAQRNATEPHRGIVPAHSLRKLVHKPRKTTGDFLTCD